jgi:hypothetical protein
LAQQTVVVRIVRGESEILLVVLYGCEAWSLTLREERRLRVFGPKRDEITGMEKIT